jgi:hypothetical protein
VGGDRTEKGRTAVVEEVTAIVGQELVIAPHRCCELIGQVGEEVAENGGREEESMSRGERASSNGAKSSRSKSRSRSRSRGARSGSRSGTVEVEVEAEGEVEGQVHGRT